MTASNSHTAEQIKDNNVAAMGADLGEVYSALWQQLTWLHQKWGHYVDLFGTSQERIVLLNETAPNFFGTVQKSVMEDVFLHVARLTDPSKSAGKDNLSFRRLPSLIVDSALRNSVDELLESLGSATQFARDWRNRKLAHGDLSLALARITEPLASASRTRVNDALVIMGNVLNSISQAFSGSTTMFEFAGEPSAGGVASMLHYLRAGKVAEAKRRERIRTGKYSEEDIDRRSI